MAVKKDALQAGGSLSSSDPFSNRSSGRENPASQGSPGPFMKLLAFSKAAESPLDDFPSERKETARWAWAVAAIASVAVVAAAAIVLVPKWRLNAAAPQFGQLAIVSQPTGAEVIVDGQPRGVSPLTLALPS